MSTLPKFAEWDLYNQASLVVLGVVLAVFAYKALRHLSH